MALDILLSNDDGYAAPGLMHLERGLSARGHRVQVIAPQNDCSGASSAITLRRPLRCQVADNGYWHVDGSPSDCVHLGLRKLCERRPDVVVSGINAGPNMGDDTLYSGTVAAAIQGRVLGVHAIAVSLALDRRGDYRSAVIAAVLLVERIAEAPPDNTLLLNVNVPDLPWEAISGFRSTRLGDRHKATPFFTDTDADGEALYWYGPLGAARDDGETTDFRALAEGFVSVSPLQLDFSDYAKVASTERWLNGA